MPEIAAEINLPEKRMRAIIREILAGRTPAPPGEFVEIQVGRLNDALLSAYGAMARNNFREPNCWSEPYANSTAIAVSPRP